MSMRSNIGGLMKSGMSQKQAIPKALSMMRMKKKKMAEGGEVEDGTTEVSPNNEEFNKYQQYQKNAADMLEDKPTMDASHPALEDVNPQPMAEGGMVEDDSEGSTEDGMSGEAVFPKGDKELGLSENVQAAQMLAKGLQERKIKANNNTNSYDAYPSMGGGQEMSQSGLTEEMDHDGPDGTEPALDWIDDGTEEPMSSMPGKPAALEHSVIDGVPGGPGLSKEAREALAMKKKSRKYGAFDPR